MTYCVQAIRKPSCAREAEAEAPPSAVHSGPGGDPGPDADGPDAPGPDARAGQTLDAVFTLAYEELRRLARAACRREAAATLTPTALVNEAWLKLRRSPELHASGPLHFKRIAARAMRQVLIEAARRRQAGKRGAGDVLVTFDDTRHGTVTSTRLLALDEALQDLAQLSPRQAAVVETRYFGGLGVAETAALLGVSEATVLRDWRAARAWLGAQLSGSGAKHTR